MRGTEEGGAHGQTTWRREGRGGRCWQTRGRIAGQIPSGQVLNREWHELRVEWERRRVNGRSAACQPQFISRRLEEARTLRKTSEVCAPPLILVKVRHAPALSAHVLRAVRCRRGNTGRRYVEPSRGNEAVEKTVPNKNIRLRQPPEMTNSSYAEIAESCSQGLVLRHIGPGLGSPIRDLPAVGGRREHIGDPVAVEIRDQESVNANRSRHPQRLPTCGCAATDLPAIA